MPQHCLETCDPLDSRQFLIAVKKLANDLGYGSDRSPFLGSGIPHGVPRQKVAPRLKSVTKPNTTIVVWQ